MNGIDVYTGQGIIDWKKVSNSGINFAMVKATQGRGETNATKNLRTFTDSKFARNMTEASKVGIRLGVYHYMTARSIAEVREEADYFIKIINPFKSKIDLWTAVDVESEIYLSDIGKENMTKITKTFIDRIGEAGYKPMLYTNPNFIKYRFTTNAFSDTDIWLAHYNVAKPMSVPNLKIWQHSVGRISGINTDVDIDIGYFGDSETANYKVGMNYTIVSGDVYSNGQTVPTRLVGKVCTISQVKSNRILLKEISSWIRI